MAYARDSKSRSLTGLRVRLPSPVPTSTLAMNYESPERIKTSERTIELEDSHGDQIHELREFYADGSWIAHGEVTSGPNEGKAWVKGHGGAVDGAFALEALGFNGTPDEVATNDWGYMLRGGQTDGQPKTGDSWFKPVLHMEQEIPPAHNPETLTAEAGVDQETDDQGRIVYEQRLVGQKHVVIRRSFSADGTVSETGRHLAGPEAGRVWETRYRLGSDGQRIAIPQPGLQLETLAGDMHGMSLRQMTIDRELSETEAATMTPEQQRQTRERMRRSITLDIGGSGWEQAEA